MSQYQIDGVGTPRSAPVDYSAAVDRYLAVADLGSASRRVYRISLVGWSWPLVDRRAPTGRERRGANPPVVPLALLDDPKARERLQRALADRAAAAEPRTLARELACLRAATAWWLAEGWINADPAVGLALTPSGASATARANVADSDRARAILALRAPLREVTLWHLLHESRAPIEQVLALNIDHLDLPSRRTRARSAAALSWGWGTARLLPMLLAGRTAGPVFVTERRAPASIPAVDRCPVTGRGRLSYRRAAELFTAVTRPLDPAGRGWTLLVLRDRAPRNRTVPR